MISYTISALWLSLCCWRRRFSFWYWHCGWLSFWYWHCGLFRCACYTCCCFSYSLCLRIDWIFSYWTSRWNCWINFWCCWLLRIIRSTCKCCWFWFRCCWLRFCLCGLCFLYICSTLIRICYTLFTWKFYCTYHVTKTFIARYFWRIFYTIAVFFIQQFLVFIYNIV